VTERVAPFVVTLNDIIEATCARTDVSRADVMSHTIRYRWPTVARRMAWYVARQTTTLSYPEIARYFNRDHTTVMTGVRVIEGLIKIDEAMLRLVQSIIIHVQEQNLERIKQWQMTNSAKSMTSSERRPA
jgi:chromosomal replication initiation ATPase DnaA